MAVLQSTNVQGTLCVNGVAVGGGKDIKYCCFTASTTFTPSQDLVDGSPVAVVVVEVSGLNQLLNKCVSMAAEAAVAK
jgi:hypothetical protein